MKTRLLIGVIAACGWWAMAQAAPGDLLTLRYHLQANVNYTTGFQVVYGAPASVSHFRILETGNYCNIVVDRVEYTTAPGDYAHISYKGPDGYTVPEGTIYAISISFEQQTWDGADCDLSVVAQDGGTTGGGIWFDVQTGANGDAQYSRNCGRTIRESLPGAQCYPSSTFSGELFCKDPQKRKALLQQFSCVRAVFGPTLEPGYSIDWNQPL